MTASEHEPETGKPAGQGGDPSMEDILASIRRILSEDEAEEAAEPPPQPPVRTAPLLRERAESHPAGPHPDVLPLDESMLVDQPQPPRPAAPPAPAPGPTLTPPAAPAVRPPSEEPPLSQAVTPEPESSQLPTSTPLLAPEAAAAASSSVGSLLRTLASERGVAVRSGGPTIEDLVREELRPLLKDWLDAQLPGLVERLVRLEIERVVGRALS
jgi:cell pole-organizing protein PopZ